VDSLDGIIDDIDIDNLQEIPKKKMDDLDLDNLLDEVAADFTNKNTSKISNNITKIIKAEKSQEELAWERAVKGVPTPMKDRWSRVINLLPTNSGKDDIAEYSARQSYAYMNFEDDVKHNAFNNSLKEVISLSCKKCNFNDEKTKAIHSAIETNDTIKKKLMLQIIKDSQSDVLRDPNFDASKFPRLAEAIKSIEA
jgi:hypothetical protein